MADDPMGQEEIEQLLSQSGGSSSSEKPETKTPTPSGGDPAGALNQGDIEALLGSGQMSAAGAAPATEDDDKLLGQDDIEKLLDQAQGGASAPKATPPPAAAKESPSRQETSSEGDVAQDDVEYLLSQAEQALESINKAGTEELPDGVATFRLEEFSGATASTDATTMDLVRDVGLDLKIELGRTHMYLEDVLKLRKGSVVPLDKLAGDPVDIFVNGRLIARGEVLVLNDNFCVRVAELIAGENVSA